MPLPRKKIKIIAGVILAIFIIEIFGSVLFLPKPAEAAGMPVHDFLKFIWDRLEKVWDKVKHYGAAVAWKNAVKTFFTRLSYDTAVWIGSGGKGQKPLFYRTKWSDYLKDAGDAALGDFLETIGRKGFGMNLCEPLDATTRFKINLGLGKEIMPPKPKCTWSEMRKNWEKEIDDPDFLKKFSAAFEPDQSDIGIYLSLESQMLSEEQEKKKNELLNRGNNWLKDITSPIGDFIETPAGLLDAKTVEDMVTKPGSEVRTFTGEVLVDSITVFTNTLVARLAERMKKGFWKLSDLTEGDFGPSKLKGLIEGRTIGGKAANQAVFASLSVVDIKNTGEYNFLENFASCPEEPEFAKPDNCVIDQNFAQAIREKLTIEEALNRGYLKSDWALIPPEDTAKNQDPLCYTYAYCHSNLLKLRQARILPLGWEIAAQISEYTTSRKTTLGEIVAGFSKPDSKFYHLINPDWVLKEPSAKCKAFVYGPFLEANESNRRQQFCVDTETCVNEDGSGECLGAWAYCTREKNIWRFSDASSCPEQFSSCRNYKRRDGKTFSFLSDTLDKDDCGVDNAGCRWYSKKYISKDLWDEKEKIYFNKNAEKCGSKDSGCREFLTLANIQGGKTAENVFNAVQNDPEKDDRYENYAEVTKIYLNEKRATCSPHDIGCKLYIPVSKKGESSIPAVVGENDFCSSECVGYRYYKEMPTFFDPGKDPVALIAKNGKTCSAQEAGCEEFTNLDVAKQGGEGKEYYTYLRQCQKPAADCASFYTWVGSEQSGYQLKVYSLKSLNDGSPAATDSSGSCCDPNLPSDNPESCAKKIIANPDCKEFYNEAGNIFYRSYSKTITCSDDCHPLRRTFSDQQSCLDTGGEWTGSFCIYMAIPSQSVKCSSYTAGCREYRGNSGSNYRLIINDNFEDLTNNGWSGGVNSNESVNVGGHSLLVNGETSKSVSLIKDKSYILSFWANGGKRIEAKIVNSSISLTLGSVDSKIGEWNFYTIGPVNFEEEPTGSEEIKISGDGVFYLDNILLKEITNSVYLIKDSWTVPKVCDQPIKEAQVDCEEYKDKKGEHYFIKSFSHLCDEDKAGCELLIDTQNSSSPYEEKFNQKAPAGDEVTVSADKLAYFVNDSKNYCLGENKGCEKFGQPEMDENGKIISWEEVYRKNNPDLYASTDLKPVAYPILCQADKESCEEFTDSEGSVVYFKDPGNKLCEYKENVATAGGLVTGWFKKGTDLACYGDFNIRHYLAADYEGWAGLCPSKYNLCTTFIDHLDVSELYPSGYEYHYINDGRVDKSSCNGSVGTKDSCVLFRDTSSTELLYNADATFKKSEASPRPGDLVSPVNCASPKPEDAKFCSVNSNDSNTIIKAGKDRACARWLACRSSMVVFDLRSNKYKEVCERIGLCDRLKKEGKSNRCDHWIKESPALLTEAAYKTRDVSWKGFEYSGYSLFNAYQIQNLTSVNVSSDIENKDYRLVYASSACNDSNGSACGPDGLGKCYNYHCIYHIDGKEIDDLNETIESTCRGYPESNSPFPAELATGWQNYDPIGQVVPFQNANVCHKDDNCECDYQKVTYGTGLKYKYFSLPLSKTKDSPDGICSGGYTDGKPCSVDDDCGSRGSCELKKRIDNYIGWKGFCLERDKSKSINNNPHQFGCLTWLPVDILPGGEDIYNQFYGAGFNLGVTKLYYCVESDLYEWRNNYEYDRDGDKCAGDGGCDPGYTLRIESHGGTCYCDVTGGPDKWYKVDPNAQYKGQGNYGAAPWNWDDYRERRCSQVASVIDKNGKNKAWTNRAWANYTKVNYLTPIKNYSYLSECTPLYTALPLMPALPKSEVVFSKDDSQKCLLNTAFSFSCPSSGYACPTDRNNIWGGGVGDYNNALSDLESIFAKSYEVFKWDGAAYISTPEAVWDVTAVGVNSVSPIPPQVAALNLLDCDRKTGKCSEGDLNTFTLNNQSSGFLVGIDDLQVAMKFFAWANENQMPIKNIIVDWGDGWISGDHDGFYRNYRGRGKCDESNFGESKEACSESYYAYYHAYDYKEMKEKDGFYGIECFDACPIIGIVGPCCQTTPRLTVIDNWFWCNPGVYGTTDCRIKGGNFFNGKVAIVP